jgi:hypothetical protein
VPTQHRPDVPNDVRQQDLVEGSARRVACHGILLRAFGRNEITAFNRRRVGILSLAAMRRDAASTWFISSEQ